MVYGSELGQRHRVKQWPSPALSPQDSGRTERGAPSPQVSCAARVSSKKSGQERPAYEIVEQRKVACSLARPMPQNSDGRCSRLRKGLQPNRMRGTIFPKLGISRDAGGELIFILKNIRPWPVPSSRTSLSYLRNASLYLRLWSGEVTVLSYIHRESGWRNLLAGSPLSPSLQPRSEELH